MSRAEQIHDDLEFVRRAASRRDRTAGQPESVYRLWAGYTLLGYALLDLAPAAAPWLLTAGAAGCAALSGYLSRKWSRRVGQEDRPAQRRRSVHFFGGMAFSMLLPFALAAAIPPLRGIAAGQVSVVMIGLVYFLGGVHYDRNLLWLGPVMMAGGVALGLVPRFGWTALGAVIAAGLAAPTLLRPRPGPTLDPVDPSDHDGDDGDGVRP